MQYIVLIIFDCPAAIGYKLNLKPEDGKCFYWKRMVDDNLEASSRKTFGMKPG